MTTDILCSHCSAPMIAGPRGGAAQNFYCTDRVDCRQGFNLVIRNGMILYSQLIGEVDDARFELYSKGGDNHAKEITKPN